MTTHDDLPVRRPGLDVSEAEDGLVILAADGGQVHHLNASAAVIFELCDGRTGAETMAVAVSAALADGSLGVADVRACIETLRERGVVT